MDADKLIKFIKQEKEMKATDERHTERFSSGFISACNIIIYFIEEEFALKQNEEIKDGE